MKFYSLALTLAAAFGLMSLSSCNGLQSDSSSEHAHSASSSSSDDDSDSKILASNGDGTKDGGGGVGVLCNGKLRALDLYEADELYHLSPLQNIEDPMESLDLYGMRLFSNFSSTVPIRDVKEYRKEVNAFVKEEVSDHFEDIPEGTHLPLSKDFTAPQLKAGCQFVQIAYYSDRDNKLYRDRAYWDLLDVQNRTALTLHEAVYRKARRLGATTSDESRRVIGMALSNQTLDPVFEPLWKAPRHMWCGAGIDGTDQEVFELYFSDEVRNGVSGMGLYAKVMKGKLQLTRTSAFIPGLTLDNFVQYKFTKLTTQVTNSLFRHSWNLMITPPRDPSHETIIGANSHIYVRAWANGEKLPPLSQGFCAFQH
jgi:hypothetical protein